MSHKTVGTRVLAVTGHRLDKLDRYAPLRLPSFATRCVEVRHPTKVLTGMALGWDTAVADACVRLGVPFVAALPCKTQHERWRHDDQVRYFELLKKASEVVYVTDGAYDPLAMELRNRWMVDRADDVLALWNGTTGGTANCVAYALSKGVPVSNVWSLYLEAPTYTPSA